MAWFKQESASYKAANHKRWGTTRYLSVTYLSRRSLMHPGLSAATQASADLTVPWLALYGRDPNGAPSTLTP